MVHNDENLQNNHAAMYNDNTQKGCKKLIVKLERLDLNKIFDSCKGKLANLYTMNEPISKPHTRNKRISYKPKEYKPFCKCGCAVPLQDQCSTLNISKKTRENIKDAKSTKKVIVRIKRAKIAKTLKPLQNKKLQKDCKKVLTNVNRVRNKAIAKTPRRENQVYESVTRFSPVRNSTILGNDDEAFSELLQNDKSQHITKDNINDSASLKNSLTEDNRIRKSLTNKPDLFEKLLFTDDEDQEKINVGQEAHIKKNVCANEHQATVNRSNTTHKFFHREHVNELQPKKVSIFEFLSQSDNSETEVAKHADPAADIINKLISEGRVRVATNHKGTGRPTLKRVRKKKDVTNKKISKIKKHNVVPVDKFDGIKEIKDNVERPLHHEPVPVFGYEDDLSNDAHFDEPINEYQNDAGFSRLARSVLLHQTNKQNEITRNQDAVEQRRLLEAARKFVSTPSAANRKNDSLPDLSPIQTLNTKQRPACPSPWRIDEDLHLPRVFNFCKNTSYLPTFSSDYIPPTPKKSHKSTFINIHANVSGNTAATTTPTNKTSNESNGSSNDLSKSANNSNAENMPPPASTPESALNKDENADIFNMRHLPNPRRTLPHRSPLKAINIVEVVSLPPWKNPVNNCIEKTNANQSKYFTNDKNDDTHNVDDLFGFKELINEDSSDDDESINAMDVANLNRQSIKRNLHKKLKNLKKWRPKNVDHHMANVTVKQTRLFGEDEGRSKQRLIKEMLCSTMINKVNAIPIGHKQDESPESNATAFNAELIISQPIETDFFNEYEPETTLNKNQPRRTYARHVKRKRKGRKNVRFLYSDESSTDSDDEKDQKELRKVQQKKKRHEANTQDKDNPVLESFVNEFNSMCKEVDNYELIVE